MAEVTAIIMDMVKDTIAVKITIAVLTVIIIEVVPVSVGVLITNVIDNSGTTK